MNDALDDGLARLTSEPPATDLAARIKSAVARRRHAQAIWRRIRLAAAACALGGAGFVLISWPPVVASIAATLSAMEANGLEAALDTLLTSPSDILLAWLDAGLVWQAAEEDFYLLFMPGVAFLAVAAFGGLAHMLHTSAPNHPSV